MTDYVIMPKQDYEEICDVVRDKTGKTDLLTSGDLAAEIEGIPSGGGGVETQEKTVEITENGTTEVTPDEGYALSKVSVNVNVAASGGGGETDEKYLEEQFAEVTLQNCTKLKPYAFYSDAVLKKVSIPKVTTMGLKAFQSCASLATVVFSDNLAEIPDSAFNNCRVLYKPNLPSGLKTIGPYAFGSCVRLCITEIPDGVVSIGESAFASCAPLATPKIPSGLYRLENSTFYGCSSTTFSELPKKLSYIGNRAFYGNSKITIKVIPRGVREIANQAFYGCTGLTEIIFRGTPTTLHSSAFSSCSNLTSIKVPWAEGAVTNAPWGATKATIEYDFVPSADPDEITFMVGLQATEYSVIGGMTWYEFVNSAYNDGSFSLGGGYVIRNSLYVSYETESNKVNQDDLITAGYTYWNGNA